MKYALLLITVSCGPNMTSHGLHEHNAIDAEMEAVNMMCQMQNNEWCWQQKHELERRKFAH